MAPSNVQLGKLEVEVCADYKVFFNIFASFLLSMYGYVCPIYQDVQQSVIISAG